MRDDQVLVGECLAGALYWNDFLAIAKATGFGDPRLVTSRPIAIGDEGIAARLAPARFYSATYRLLKLPGLEPTCEDCGQAVRYNGGIAGSESSWDLDGHHSFEAGRVTTVCGNSWRMLRETRFAPFFTFIGDFSRHYGIFPGCGTAIPFSAEDPGTASQGCC